MKKEKETNDDFLPQMQKYNNKLATVHISLHIYRKSYDDFINEERQEKSKAKYIDVFIIKAIYY